MGTRRTERVECAHGRSSAVLLGAEQERKGVKGPGPRAGERSSGSCVRSDCFSLSVTGGRRAEHPLQPTCEKPELVSGRAPLESGLRLLVPPPMRRRPRARPTDRFGSAALFGNPVVASLSRRSGSKWRARMPNNSHTRQAFCSGPTRNETLLHVSGAHRPAHGQPCGIGHAEWCACARLAISTRSSSGYPVCRHF